MYITIEEYADRYADIDPKIFNRLSARACRAIDRWTTGFDGTKKLQIAYPVAPDAVEAVKSCAGALIRFFEQIEQAEASASARRILVETPEGYRGTVVSSVTSGTESVSYSGKNNTVQTSVDRAAEDVEYMDRFLRKTVQEYLSGVPDANGINLLYMGAYPHV